MYLCEGNDHPARLEAEKKEGIPVDVGSLYDNMVANWQFPTASQAS
jgi:hypothetical protein